MIEAPPPTSEPSPTTTPARDPALDHRGAERAGVVVHEALVHDGGALGQVGAEPDPVGVGDPDAGRQHVVDHPRELVDAEDRHVLAARPRSRAPGRLEARRPRTGPAEVHTTLVSSPKTPSMLIACGRDQPVDEQVQPQPDVLGGRAARPAGRRSRPAGPRGVTPRASSWPSSAVSSAGAWRDRPGAAPSAGSGNHTSRTVPCGVEGEQAVAVRGTGDRVVAGEVMAEKSTEVRRGPARPVRADSPDRWPTGRCGRRCTPAAGRRGRSGGRTPRSCARGCRAPRSGRPGVDALRRGRRTAA